MIKEILLGDRLIQYDLQRKKVKNINIRVKRDLTVHVSASPKVSQKRIEEILTEKSGFILSALSKYEELPSMNVKSFGEADRLPVFGRILPLNVIFGTRSKAEITEDAIKLELKSPDDTAAKEKALQKALDALCRDVIERLCREIYPKYDRYIPAFPEIKYRHMKSRWGSCNYKKIILTFNYSLIHAPLECIEYVVYHEFTHFIHPNHSSDFYRELARHVPQYKALKKELEKLKI